MTWDIPTSFAGRRRDVRNVSTTTASGLSAARDNVRFADKRIAGLEAQLVEREPS
ncbi:hypothetical protein [Streptomyces sp. NPDC057496]|uniref:hypothetical protein n=1 Tax=Streptomyces sp. NPDC057496 TaxID=3346149 RepID=UPI00369A715F